MADSKSPVEVPLTELQKYKLEAAETGAKLVKERIVADIQRKYAIQQAVEVQRTLDSHPQVRAAEMRLNAVTNEVLEQLSSELPEGYAVAELVWEESRARAIFSPAQAKQRLPQPPASAEEDAPPVE